MTNPLPAVITAHIDAVNAFDTDAVVATFAPGALLNDNGREFWGSAEIRTLVASEIVGPHVTMDVTDARPIDTAHQDLWVVRARYDGEFDKTNLPDPLILTNYFMVHADRVVALIIVLNR